MTDALPRLVRAGVLTGLSDGVAFGWSAVFLFIVLRLGWVQRLLASPYGVLKVASVYGPCIWLVMSLVVIPLLVHRPPSLNTNWWIQLIGHFPFVGIPIVATLGRVASTTSP